MFLICKPRRICLAQLGEEILWNSDKKEALKMAWICCAHSSAVHLWAVFSGHLIAAIVGNCFSWKSEKRQVLLEIWKYFFLEISFWKRFFWKCSLLETFLLETFFLKMFFLKFFFAKCSFWKRYSSNFHFWNVLLRAFIFPKTNFQKERFQNETSKKDISKFEKEFFICHREEHPDNCKKKMPAERCPQMRSGWMRKCLFFVAIS